MQSESTRIGAERRFVIGAAAIAAGLVWTHGLAAVFRQAGLEGAPLAAVALSLAAAAASLGAALAAGRRGDVALGALGGLAAAGGLVAAVPGTGPAALALPVVSTALTPLARGLARRLPATIDGLLGRRRALALVWGVAAIVAVIQLGRLATMMTDWSVTMTHLNEHPFWHGHQCLSAYVHGAELAERGEPNLYDIHHYPGLYPEAQPETRIANMIVEDPYQYPPQFLLLPRLALALTDDFGTIRAVWFALQTTLFAAVFVALARWVGGRAGRLAVALLPVVLASLPVLFNFQFGQFHLAAVTLGVAAMIAFDRGRAASGGALLAGAVLAKLFPAVLLVPLLVQRRFRELAWTGGWGVALTLLALAVLGPAPFESFFEYHVPRLSSGAAFAFDEAWPDLAPLVVTDNQGAFGLARKLGVDKPAAALVGRLFALALLGLAALAGARRAGASRRDRALGWLGLVGLATLASPGAWADYVATTAIWILALAASGVVEDRRWLAPFGVVAGLQFFLLGTMPLGNWTPIPLMTVVSTLGSLGLIAIFAAPVVRPLLSGRFTETRPALAVRPAASADG